MIITLPMETIKRRRKNCEMISKGYSSMLALQLPMQKPSQTARSLHHLPVRQEMEHSCERVLVPYSFRYFTKMRQLQSNSIFLHRRRTANQYERIYKKSD